METSPSLSRSPNPAPDLNSAISTRHLIDADGNADYSPADRSTICSTTAAFPVLSTPSSSQHEPTEQLAPSGIPPNLVAPLPGGEHEQEHEHEHHDIRPPLTAVKKRLPAPISTGPLLPLPTAPDSLLQNASSFSHNRSHRKNVYSIDSIPRQTIMKALVSRPPPTSNISISSTIQSLLAGSNCAIEDGPARLNGATRRSRRLSEAFGDLHLETEDQRQRLAALHSPCYVHRRFDDAVDISAVLSSLEEDEGLSHSRLVQTATGVREVSKQLQRRPIKTKVRNVMIVTKARDNSLVDLTRELTDFLLTTPRYRSDVGVNVYVDAKLRRSKRFDAQSLLDKNPKFETMLRYWTPDLCWTSPEKFDLVLTLGGDGTVLYTSWLFQRIVPPILSFSLGSLGFLTNFEFASFRDSLNAVMGDEGMRINLRMRFTCTVYRANTAPSNSREGETEEGIEAEQFEVLNELVIDRGPSPYVSNLELFGDNHLLTIVQADGIILSTPTGSTAYSLSAGGSLVHPDIPAILLTPICPHTLSFRPMLLNDSLALKIKVPERSRATAYCAFDGRGRVELRQGDYVTIAASQYPFPTVLSRPTEWFDSLSRTLRWNSRGATQRGWAGAENQVRDGAVNGEVDGGAACEKHEEEKFDIDFDDDASRDSGYSAEGSSAGVGGGSPRRRGLGAAW